MARNSGAFATFRFDATIGLVVTMVLFTTLIEGATIDVHALRIGLSFLGGVAFALVCFVADRSRSGHVP